MSSSFNNSPVLVTGGTGFLGRKLVERLIKQGRIVTVLARTPAPDLEMRGVRLVCAAINDEASVCAACRGMETVFHVAAKVGVWGRYDDFFRANVLGTRAILAGCHAHGVARLVYTSTPSVVYNGFGIAGADESLPLATDCPSAYPLTKAIAEREVLEANSPILRTVALRPHLIWGAGDPHLVPRILARAYVGRLRIVGDGKNRVDMIHIENAVDAHLAAEAALAPSNLWGHSAPDSSQAAGRAYFITDGVPVVLWDWINSLLVALGEPPITKHISLRAASMIGSVCEAAWRVFPLKGEPPMTRFVAEELAKDHWFSIESARRDLGYTPHVSMEAGMAEMVAALKAVRGA